MSDRDYPTCSTCRHYAPTDYDGHAPHPEVGACDSPKWRYGYHAQPRDILPDGILVESDEGWGAVVAAGFGCIHHEERP